MYDFFSYVNQEMFNIDLVIRFVQHKMIHSCWEIFKRPSKKSRGYNYDSIANEVEEYN